MGVDIFNPSWEFFPQKIKVENFNCLFNKVMCKYFLKVLHRGSIIEKT